MAQAADIVRIFLGDSRRTFRSRSYIARRTQQRQQVIVGIAVGGVGEFVGERLHGEGVINIRNPAQPTDADVGRSLSVLGAEVGNVEGSQIPPQRHFACAAVDL